MAAHKLNLLQWQRFLFHITHQENVPGIFARGIQSKNEAKRLNLKHRSIAFENIQERRSTIDVPVGPGGVLHDYVPLFFGARSPMLYAVRKDAPQAQVFYLLVKWEVLELKTTVFTDGNASTYGTQFFCGLDNLDKVDKEAVAATHWAQPPELRRKKSAEVLVWKQVPPERIAYIGVINDAAKAQAEKIVQARNSKPQILVAPEFYYL